MMKNEYVKVEIGMKKKKRQIARGTVKYREERGY